MVTVERYNLDPTQEFKIVTHFYKTGNRYYFSEYVFVVALKWEYFLPLLPEM